MQEVEIILGLLLVMALLLGLANKLQIPYPILLVLGGLGFGFIPGLPRIELKPELVFLLFLPPLLQSAAFFTPIRDFKANLRAISLLAVGLVLFTTAIIAVIAHNLIDGMSWATAFVLGAIISPPDAIAATSIAQKLRLPRRIVTVLEGESLVNDATSLIAYRVAVVAVVTGAFSMQDAGLQFILSSLGGSVIGIAMGWLSSRLLKVLNDTSIILILTFLLGFGAYLLAEQFHVSGVLAVVALGIYSSRQWGTDDVSPETRLQVEIVWRSVVSILNGLVFILIGLQLPRLLDALANESIGTILFYAVIINLTLIVTRFVWVFPATYLPRFLSRKVREREGSPPWQWIVIVAWTGMRGVVSLAAALSLPLTVEGGGPFPQRDMIIFLTFTVILVTLVLQGLSLPFLIQWLKVKDDGGEEREEAKARLVAAKAGLKRLDELAAENWVAREVVEDVSQHYELRVRRYRSRYAPSEENEVEERENENRAIAFERLQTELLQAEFAAVYELRNAGVINDEIMRRVQRDLDLERIRLNNSQNGNHASD